MLEDGNGREGNGGAERDEGGEGGEVPLESGGGWAAQA